jgi:phosphinothricin acetyltransferase
MNNISIRRLEHGDLPALLDLYNHYVVHSPITFDVEPRTLDQWEIWAKPFAASGRHQCFVALDNGAAIGWAASFRYHERAAYDTTIMTSTYLRAGELRKGIGRRLYAALFEALAGQDIHRALGAITLPNAPSVGLHQAMGFEKVGVMPEVGRKFGQFWDVAIYLRPMP